MQFIISQAHFLSLERLRLQTLWLMASYCAVYTSELSQPHISFNTTLRKMPITSSASRDPSPVPLQITCSLGSTSTPIFNKFVSLNLLRCLYKDDDGCKTADGNFCILFRAFQVGSTVIRYCGCRDLTCHQMAVNISFEQGYYSITLPAASCKDAGVYRCRVEEVDKHTSEVSQTLDMPPGPLKLYARLVTPEKGILRGSILTLWCRVRSTLRVNFVWFFKSSPLRARWYGITPAMASVETYKPRLSQRCDIPWTSKMTRYVNLSDEQRVYQCAVVFFFQHTNIRIMSGRYVLNKAAYKANSSTHVGSFHRPGANNHSIGPSSVRTILLAREGNRQELTEPLPPAYVSIVLTCLSVLTVAAVLCLTTILFMESNLVRWTTSFFRSSSNLTPGDQSVSRRPQRHLVPALLEWLEYRGTTTVEDEDETQTNEASSRPPNNTPTPLHPVQVTHDSSWPPLRNELVQVIGNWLDTGVATTDPHSSLGAPQARSGPVSATSPRCPPPTESALPTSIVLSPRTTRSPNTSPRPNAALVSEHAYDPARNEVPVNFEVFVRAEAPTRRHTNRAQNANAVAGQEVDLVDIMVLMEDEVPGDATGPADTAQVPVNTEVPPGNEASTDSELPASPEMSGDSGGPGESEGNNSCHAADLLLPTDKAKVHPPALSVYHVTGSEEVTLSLGSEQTAVSAEPKGS